MKRPYFALLLTTILFGASQHGAAQELSIHQQKDIKNQVDEIFTEMVSYAEKLNYDQLTDRVDDRYHAGFIVNNQYYADYSSLVDVVKAGSQGVTKQTISIGKKKITVLSERLALLTTSGITDVTLNDGRKFKVNFYWSFIYQKFGDQWKVIHSHQSRSS
ncbi:MAG TPA: nuclear transport factor 2 family protein [Sunxiuqinia sp.]|nr:nuclear transport factor 2 family protein [Sunxiuqinia sp.]